MSIYVVAGATGHVGAVVARALLARHIEVRAIVRSEEKGAELKGLGAELRIGSLEDSAFLTEVLTGADGAFLMIPPIPAANAEPRNALRETPSLLLFMANSII